jgi:hypothetical protein
VGICALVVAVLVAATLEVLISRAKPILKARLLEALSARYHSRVELGDFDVSLLKGFEVSGQTLAIYPYNVASSTPTFSARHFSFRTGYESLLRSPMHIGHVQVEGLHINLPPKSQRKGVSGSANHGSQTNVAISVDEMECANTVLTLGTDKPGKVPLRFFIQTLTLRSIAAGQPIAFGAILTNPKPLGQIETRGSWGPWNTDHPGTTAVSGTYGFHNADLSTIKGIGGTLSSQGQYQGTLDRIVVDGKTETPDFEVRISGHKVPLHTEFHAIVDATDGNTYLQPVRAQFLHSSLIAQGYVVRGQGEPGRHLYLDIAMDQARVEDLLRMGVHTDPPVLEGKIKLHTKLDLPPGTQDVAHRLRLQGSFAVVNGQFSSDKIQRRIDELSLRSQGQVELATEQQRDGKFEVAHSQLRGDFNLADANLNLSNLLYDVPGTSIKLAQGSISPAPPTCRPPSPAWSEVGGGCC